MPVTLGDDFKIYYDSANDMGGTPTWAEQTDAGDISFDRGPTEVAIPKRGTKFKKSKNGQQKWQLSFPLNYDPSNAFVTAIEAAINAGTSIHVAITDGAIATDGTNIWEADWCVLGDPIGAALDNGGVMDISLTPHADSANEPTKTTVSS